VAKLKTGSGGVSSCAWWEKRLKTVMSIL
jgi:hypothetical protein